MPKSGWGWTDFLYQWHKFPFHDVDWAIGSGIGIALLILKSLAILDFMKKHSLLSISPCTLVGKVQEGGIQYDSWFELTLAIPPYVWFCLCLW